MTDQTDNQKRAGLDQLWLAVAVVLVVAGLAAFYLLGSQQVAVRVASVIAGSVLGVLAFSRSSWGLAAWQFAVSSRVELRKMVWPTYEDSRKTTLIVFIFVVVLGFFFWGVDALFASVTRHLLGTGT